MVEKFTKPLLVKYIDGRKWEICEDFVYYVGKKEDKDRIIVRKGFITDFASIPRLFWSIIGPPAGKYGKAAVLHDWLYKKGLRTRKDADDIFLEAMEVLGVGYFKRKMMYFAVRLFGFSAYQGEWK